MVKSKDLNNMFQNYIKRTKVSCAVSAPVLVCENSRYYLASFVFFFTKEDIQTGMVNRPTEWLIADLESGQIIEERNTSEKEFSDAKYDIKYDIKVERKYDLARGYYEEAYKLLDAVREKLLSSGQLDKTVYKDYMDRILANIPKAYQRFYLDLSISFDETMEQHTDQEMKFKEYFSMTAEERLEKYIEENCGRICIPYSEFSNLDFYGAVMVFYTGGYDIKKKSWSMFFVEPFAGDLKSYYAFTEYERAVAQFKKNEQSVSVPLRVQHGRIEDVFRQDRVLTIINTKGHSIRVYNEKKISKEQIVAYYQKQIIENVKKDSYEDVVKINASNIIDWLLSLDDSFSEDKLERQAEKFLKYEDIAAAVQHHIENDTYDESVCICGYTAKKLHDEVGDKLSVVGVYNYMITLKENPENGIKWLKQGLPRK